MGGRKTLTLVVPALVLALVLGGVLYGLRQDEAPEGEAGPPPRTEEGAADPARPVAESPAVAPPEPSGAMEQDAGPAERADVAPVPAPPPATVAPPEVRSRSLAALRGSVSRVLRSCSPRLTGGPVRVFVSMDAVVGGGKIQPAQVRVRTSSPANDEFVRCVSEAVQGVSVPAAAGEPDGSFPATVSLLSGSP